MAEPSKGEKQVYVHIGPHRSGSTALQRCLIANHSTLKEANLFFLHSEDIHTAAMHLANREFHEAENILHNVARQISKIETAKVLLSQEDFAGDLPGRSRRKVVYSTLTKNLRILRRSLSPHRVKFIFFQRDQRSWLRSCYHQHLKHRTTFSSYEAFQDHFGSIPAWEDMLTKPRSVFNDDLVILPYSEDAHSGVRALLKIAGLDHLNLNHFPEIVNASPGPENIRLLERINALSAFKKTAWFSKTLVLQNWVPDGPKKISPIPDSAYDRLALIALPDLFRRTSERISIQTVEDILPDRDISLDDYVFSTLPVDVTLTSASRADIRDQSRILDYHLRGKSQLSKLNALTISYLRRNTAHTPKAAHLFHRIWREKGVLLVNELSTRWLISTLQTFLEHGQNEAQRMIGTCGYFYSNVMKIYEGERAIEGLEQDGIYGAIEPKTENKFPGLDRYQVGGTDLLLNTNALALDLAMRDDVAGLVLNELLLRVKHSGNVFTRMDQSRKRKGVVVEGFENTWSFFLEPQ